MEGKPDTTSLKEFYFPTLASRDSSRCENYLLRRTRVKGSFGTQNMGGGKFLQAHGLLREKSLSEIGEIFKILTGQSD